MNKKILTANASIQIACKAHDVYEAIVNPEIMKNYFIHQGTDRLDSETKLSWSFPEFPGEFPVQGLKCVRDTAVRFDWSNGIPGQYVEIILHPYSTNATVVKVTEYAMDTTEEGIEKMKRQTEGWANFLACLKAHLEYGINLRKGAFEFMAHQ